MAISDIIQTVEPRLQQVVTNIHYFASDAHEGQTRDDGSPIFNHPLWVGEECYRLTEDPALLCAGYMHDVYEDTDATSADFFMMIVDGITDNETKQDCNVHFGDQVHTLVQGVTKIPGATNNEFTDHIMYFADQDVRVAILKLVDRLHNTNTMQPFDQYRKLRFLSVNMVILGRTTKYLYQEIRGFDEVHHKLEESTHREYQALKL